MPFRSLRLLRVLRVLRPHRPDRRVLFALLAVLALVAVTLAPSGTASAQRAGSLTISPTQFYGGQGLEFSGSIGTSGTTRIWLEYHMGRTGDTWTRIENSTRTTEADGSFDFTFPARGMNNIKIRVAAKGTATPAVTFNAHDQAVQLTVSPDHGGEPYLSYPVSTGETFSIDVDSSPSYTQDVEPVLAGRGVTLQRRSGTSGYSTTWTTVATSSLNGAGRASFDLTAPASTGTLTYRAVLDEWTADGSEIGWFPSFPLDIVVGGKARLAPRTAPARASAPVGRTTVGGTAFTRYGWSPALWDFGWEYGESIADGPFRGTRPRGHWVEYSDGSGRVAKHNGGMMLESKYGVVTSKDVGPGDHGTTAMTMSGNSRRTGRWEMRIRPWQQETGAANYRIRAELVPANPTAWGCGRRSIVIADITPKTAKVSFGAYTPKRAWTATRKRIRVDSTPNAYAVEVGKRHITWFVNGRVVGVLKKRAALPKTALTLRISMNGVGNKEMNHTYAIMDWVRGWSLERGRQVKKGKALRAGPNRRHC